MLITQANNFQAEAQRKDDELREMEQKLAEAKSEEKVEMEKKVSEVREEKDEVTVGRPVRPGLFDCDRRWRCSWTVAVFEQVERVCDISG